MVSLALDAALCGARERIRDLLTRRGPRAYADTHDVALDLLGGAPPSKVLDVGAGRGELCRRLSDLGHDVTAVDGYVAQFEGAAPAIEADLNRAWPFENGSFDVVMGVEILEHLESPRFFLRETARLLRPRGVAVVSTPNLTTILSRLLFTVSGQWDLFFNHPWRLRDPYCSAVDGHITPLPKWLLAHHAREVGFDVEATAYSRAWIPGVPWRLNPLPSSPAFGRILLTRLRKRGR